MVRPVVGDDAVERFGELQQRDGEGAFVRGGRARWRFRDFGLRTVAIRSTPRLREDAAHAGVAVLHVRGRVAVHGQHLVVAEHVVAGAVVREVGVLDGADADRSATCAALFVRRAAARGRASSFCADDRVGALDRFVEQARQADRRAAAGFERPAVVAEHGAEADVLQFDVVVAPQLRGGEQLLEVQRLAMIDDVQNRVGLPLAHAVLDRRQIGRGVQERAVLLLHDHRRVVAVEEHADGAVAFAGEPFSFRSSTTPRSRSW